MKKILFPTDFSDASKNARRVAFQIAKRLNAQLVVLHSLNTAQQYINMSLSGGSDPMLPGFDPDIVINAIKEQSKGAQTKLNEIIEEGQQKGVEVKDRLSSGELFEDVVEVSNEEGVDMIVLGTHGASGFKEAFLGSNAQKIVRSATVPVLTVNEVVEDFDVHKIVYASDFLEEKVNELIPKFIDFAQLFNAELKLVYINSPAYFESTKDTLVRIGEVADKYGFKLDEVTIYNDFNIEDGIIHYARMIDGDMIAMATHGFKGLKKLISDNITETIVNHAKRPVLSIHC